MPKMSLPKKVFVFMNIASDGETWLSAEETAEACAEKGEKRLVGVYELKEKLNVTLEVKEELLVSKAG